MSLTAFLAGPAMLKLLICLLSAFLISAVLLHLRHERMEINYRINQAHRHLQLLQAELGNQQVLIGNATGPAAVAKVAAAHKLNLMPATPVVPMTRARIDD